jgi:adenosylcobinamide-phosphate synthase
MIGYKNKRYEQFGKSAAIIDDIANYFPSRITAVLMLIISFKLNKFQYAFNEGKKHSSPNAGYPEAALATILNCRFGGPNIYYGQLVEKPFIGNNSRPILDHEISRVSWINYKSSILFLVLCLSMFTRI